MLSVLIWVPILAALLVGFGTNYLKAEQLRGVSLAIATSLLGWTIFLVWQFDPNHIGIQLQESFPWIANLGLNYHIGIDGLSLPLLVLNALLVWIAIYSSGDVKRPGFYYALMLLLSGGVSGAFVSQNLLLFFLFYEVELVPLYLLIAIWGGARRGYAATKFLIYTAVSGILLVAAFFGTAGLVGSELHSGLSFDLDTLQTQILPIGTQTILLVTILVAFGIKIPIVPLHTWLPDAHVEASTPVSVLLAGILLKLGTYGLLRFGLQLFPEAWQAIAPILAIWAVVSVIYGCLTAITQTDMKKMVAYSSVGHMGYILLGASAASSLSLLGVSLQMVSHGLISGLLFLIVGVIYSKAGTRDINNLNGLFNPERGMPLIGTLMVIGVMASAGIPGMMGFISEFILFRGSFTVFPVQTLLCMIGTGLTAVYFLILIDRVFFGRICVSTLHIDRPISLQPTLPRVTWNERMPSMILASAIVALGLQPSWIVQLIEHTTTAIAKSMPVQAAVEGIQHGIVPITSHITSNLL
jgi:NAD(P)H-quinone oxidoreductase subunit 4